MAKRKTSGNTVNSVWNLAKPIADSLGLSIWDVRFVKEGSQWYLRIFIDKQDGITIEDCEAMSRAIDKPLDDMDFIEQSYCLEVCSPGIERELIREEHFARFKGEKVMVKMVRPMQNGDKEFKGILKDFNNGIVDIVINGEDEISVAKKDTVYIKLDDFND